MKKFQYDKKYFMIKQSKNNWCPPHMSGPLDFYKRYLLYIVNENNIVDFSYYVASLILNKQITSEADVWKDGYKPGQYL